MTRVLALLAALLLAAPLTAQTYPDRTAAGLNDFADMVEEEAEARINDTLANMAAVHGTEAAVVTLSSVRFYAQNATIEDYATGLFNAWEIGDAEANNGLLILVFRDDREVRVEMGSGYDADMRKAIDRVVDEDILPQFREGDFSGGIEAGVNGLLSRVVAPAPANAAAQEPAAASAPTGEASEGGSNALYYILGAIAAGIAGIVALNRRSAAKLAAQPCANCGKTGLQRSREVLRAATETMEGAGETRLTCPSCGHVEATPYTISKVQPAAPKGGGGQSKGDGATGKW